jgi:CelD/BcsL family acetyltransferase involved in cellulose biosynthesis
LRVVLHREIPEDSNLQRQWNRLVLQMEQPEVFYNCEWGLAVQSAYRDRLKPLLLLAYDGDDLVGVASLATDSAEENVSFLAATTGDYCDFISDPSQRAEFVEAVLAELARRKTRSLVLANLPADSATPAALQAASGRHGFRVFLRPAYLCAQIELGSTAKRQELKAALTGKKKLRRYLRAMEREGPVTFVHLQSWAQIQAALPEFADAHVARFVATQRVSSLATAERRNFLEDLARRFSETGVVTLSILKVGDRPVAWNYGFQFCGSWFWYQPTFDSRQEENSPGHCLLSRIVIESCDMDGMKRIDLGLGAEGYKERFGNSTRQTLHATLSRSAGRHLRVAARYRIASVLKRSARVEAAVRNALTRLRLRKLDS